MQEQLEKISIELIDGSKTTMKYFEKKVLLIVNTASRCGYTPQYSGLQSLHDRFQSRGFAVIGAPCNQFGKQEPDDETAIQRFCSLEYGVKFPLLKKLEVNGPHQHPLYHYLLKHSELREPIRWNFEKFLIDRKGNVVERFDSKVKPDSDNLVKAVESLLEKNL